MKTYLTAHLESDQDINEFEYSASQARPVLKRLIELIEKEQEELFKKSRKLDNYNTSNWAMQQADFIGSDRIYSVCLLKLQDLLEV